MQSFPCTSCGACCKNITGIKELESFDIGNGICKYLDTKTNLCMIYESRPEICKIDSMYNKYYAKFYTKEQFYMLNIKACKILRKKEDIEKSLRF